MVFEKYEKWYDVHVFSIPFLRNLSLGELEPLRIRAGKLLAIQAAF